jgi:alpha-tubulin suppressor-like RCC1 family protein
MTDRTVRCWGDNQYGQLGDGTRDLRDRPSPPIPDLVAVELLVAGADHTCAMLATRELVCWGRNHFGQIGDDTTEDRLTPTPVMFP